MKNTNNAVVTDDLVSTGEIVIISGEGENGTRDAYVGARNAKAVISALEIERDGGDRWAILEIDGERY